MQNVPGLRALTRLGIYWGQEALAFGMTKRPNALKFIEAYAKYNIRRSVKDRALRRKLTPNYRIGCKRILNSTNVLPCRREPEDPTDHRPHQPDHARRDRHGRRRPSIRKVDVIVYATGFHVTDSYSYVQIKGQRGEDLVDRWNQGRHRCAPRDHRRRRAQPVLPAGTQHRAGAQLGGVHDRIPDPLRRRRDQKVRQVGRAGAGADARRAGRVQRRAAAAS